MLHLKRKKNGYDNETLDRLYNEGHRKLDADRIFHQPNAMVAKNIETFVVFMLSLTIVVSIYKILS